MYTIIYIYNIYLKIYNIFEKLIHVNVLFKVMEQRRGLSKFMDMTLRISPAKSLGQSFAN